MTIGGTDSAHVLVIGDWGGLDGTLWTNMWPPTGRAREIAYTGGAKPGPSVFPRTRWNLPHTELLCSHSDFITCYNTKGADPCKKGCGFVDGIDTQPQLLVAAQMEIQAAKHKPGFVLNVGDNFYWGGIEKNCGTPMGEISYEAKHQFDQIFENVYSGPGLQGVPWLSVLGNHDWGGRVFNNGWDQQIAYTWHSQRWVLPAPFYSQHVEYPDLGFSVDLLFIDSNAMDASDPDEDPEHNICGSKHNPADACCTAAGGPSSVDSCKDWFDDFWRKNKEWAEEQMGQAQGDWQIVVTHFPCGHEAAWYRKLHSMGLDLLVTGHRHDQEIWDAHHPRSGELGGLTCLVSGGGGGISSEATPVENDGNWAGEAQYGFYDLVLSKTSIAISSIIYNGTVVKTTTVSAR